MSKIPRARKMYCYDFAPPASAPAPLRWVLTPTEAKLIDEKIQRLERENEFLKKELARETQNLSDQINMIRAMINHDRQRVNQLDEKMNDVGDSIKSLESDIFQSTIWCSNDSF
jgi:peptidoglycan hydrolase CwlO-like protein